MLAFALEACPKTRWNARDPAPAPSKWSMRRVPPRPLRLPSDARWLRVCL